MTPQSNLIIKKSTGRSSLATNNGGLGNTLSHHQFLMDTSQRPCTHTHNIHIWHSSLCGEGFATMIERIERRSIAQRLPSSLLQVRDRFDLFKVPDHFHDSVASYHQSHKALQQDVGGQRGELLLDESKVRPVLRRGVSGVSEGYEPETDEPFVCTERHCL